MKIICIGRNYIEHAKEMGKHVTKDPIFFLKPDTSLISKKQPFFLPNFSENIHYEAELVYKIKKVGKSIDPVFSKDYYEKVGLGIDFTARDLQAKCKSNGNPWEIAKSFDQSALVSEHFFDVSSIKD